MPEGRIALTANSSRTLLSMSKFWRIVLAWLLAVALPMQGYAAQTMLLCGPASQQSKLLDVHSEHEHVHTGMVDGGSSAHATDKLNLFSKNADNVSLGEGKHAGKCSVCSSCCSFVAITTNVVSFAVVAPELPEVPTIQIAHDRVMVGGLERPPRFSRA